MSTNPKDVQEHLKDKVQNKSNNTEELVFDKHTMKLVVKNKGDVASNDRRVHTAMTKAFQFLAEELLAKGGN